MSFDLVDPKYVVAQALPCFSFQPNALLFIETIRCKGVFFEEIGELGLIVLNHDSLAIFLEFLELGEDIES